MGASHEAPFFMRWRFGLRKIAEAAYIVASQQTLFQLFKN